MPVNPVDNPVFQPSTNDISVRFLDFVLGPGWQWYIFPGNAPTEAGGAVGEMFLVLSTIMMGVMTLMILWVGGTGVIGTAHEGTPLGKKYSSIWTPLRGVAGAAFIAPLPWAGGFSLLQAILLLFVYYGIGAGDAMLRAPMEYARDNMGLLSAPQLNDNTGDITYRTLMTLTARAMLSEQEDVNVGASQVTWIDRESGRLFINWGFNREDALRSQIFNHVLEGKENESIAGAWVISLPILEGQGVKADALGKIVVPCVDKDSELCARRRDAAGEFIAQLNDVAQRIVSNYKGGAELPFSPGMVSAAERNLATAMRETAVAAYGNEHPVLRDRLNRFTGDIENLGWMGLGAYHWSLASFQERTNQELDTRLGYIGMDLEHLLKVVSDSSRLQGYMDLVKNLVARSQADMDMEIARKNAADSGRDDSVWDGIWHTLSKPFMGTLQIASEKMTEGDPVANLQSVGSFILAGVETAYVGYVTAAGAATAAGKTAESASNFAGGLGAIIGAPANGIAGFAQGAIAAAAPAIVTVLLSLFVVGAVLAFYLPAVPFIIYLMGALGWAILVLETLVAAPIWALAHALPTPDGQPMGTERQGYMLFLRVLLQPPLMVIGYFFGIVLFLPFGWFVGESFSLFVAATSGGFMFLVGMVVYFIILDIIIIVGAHKIFGLATWLPDHVLRWIGAQAHSLGEDRDENKINAMAVGAFRSGERATRGAHRAAGQGLQKFRGTKKGAEEAGNAKHAADNKQHAAGRVVGRREE